MKPTQTDQIKAADMLSQFNLKNIIHFNSKNEDNYSGDGVGIYPISSQEGKGLSNEDVEKCFYLIRTWANDVNVIQPQVFYDLNQQLIPRSKTVRIGIIPPVPPPGDGD